MAKSKQKILKKHKVSTFDYLAMIFFPVAAAFITNIFQISYLGSIFLFFALPSVYLTVRKPDFLKKGLLVILSGVIFSFIVSYFAVRDGSWYDSTIFSFRLLNGFPLEDLLWFPGWFYFVVIFYDYFIDRPKGGKEDPVNHRYKVLIEGLVGVLLVFLSFYIFAEKYLHIPYFYSVLMIGLGVLPLILELYYHPHLVFKFSKVIIYFFFINLLHEIVGLSGGHWVFPGQRYIGWVKLGSLNIPFEEFFFWMLIGAGYILTWYEHFLDNDR